jgi:hypothetical protein
MIHSPFEVQEEFISPLLCEQLVTALALKEPDRDLNGNPLKHERNVPAEYAGRVLQALDDIRPLIEQRYSAVFRADPLLRFQQYWENQKAPAEGMGCENSRFVRKKWQKIKDVDLVGFLWLKDFHDSVPLDPRMEVYGGKLEFPGYNFSLVPTRGTLVLFPATPHFVTAISHVLLGSLEQLKIQITLKSSTGGVWQYDPKNYPGSYTDWLIP